MLFNTDLHSKSSVWNKYQILWAAVLLQAIKDLRHKGFNKKNCLYWRGKAKYWLSSRKGGEQSFVWVCNVLDIDPDRTRRAIFKNNKTIKA